MPTPPQDPAAPPPPADEKSSSNQRPPYAVEILFNADASEVVGVGWMNDALDLVMDYDFLSFGLMTAEQLSEKRPNKMHIPGMELAYAKTMYFTIRKALVFDKTRREQLSRQQQGQQAMFVLSPGMNFSDVIAQMAAGAADMGGPEGEVEQPQQQQSSQTQPGGGGGEDNTPPQAGETMSMPSTNTPPPPPPPPAQGDGEKGNAPQS